VPYRDVNVAEDAEGREEVVRLTGRMAVPVIVVDDQVIVGFDKAKLQAALG
jgi:glutaredoxin